MKRNHSKGWPRIVHLIMAFVLAGGGSTASAGSELTMGPEYSTVSLDGQPYFKFSVPELTKQAATVKVGLVDDRWHHVEITWDLEQPTPLDDLAVEFTLLKKPDFWWAPHLSPRDGDAIAQHVFRSPAIIAACGRVTAVLVPDLGICGAESQTPWYLDYDARKDTMWLGLSKTEVWTHVGFRKIPGMVLPSGPVKLAFFLALYEDKQPVQNPWHEVSRFLWRRYALPLHEKGHPSTVPLDRFVEHTYHWAFDSWKDAVWQEFDLNGRRVGAPAFIVNVTQSPNYLGPHSLREYLSIWNQAWFSSLRSASGVMRFARRTSRSDLMKKAELTKELALAAPMNDGLFPTVIRTEMERVTIAGSDVHRSKGWDTHFWANSNRVPRELGISEKWYHVLDCSWTALLMLRWHEELQPDQRLLDYARAYADKLLALQDKSGFFPAWIDPDTLVPNWSVLGRSPETSMSATFLLKLAELTGVDRYRMSALRALDAVLAGPAAAGRWYDYETYWSCCRFGLQELGHQYPRNAMYKQNSLSMFWTAEAALAAYRATKQVNYLHWGRRTLDELSMVQQVWQPPYIYIPALGGFGVMNFDGEWNDSRQTLFAELFMDYYREVRDPQLMQRGIAALKAGFVMMYCPENPRVKALWEKRFPFFGPADYGFTMENYGHGGVTSSEGIGIGTFTIYDWGNGAASEARNRIYDHYGDVFIDRQSKKAFGIDSIDAQFSQDGGVDRVICRDLANQPREVHIMFDDGSSRMLKLDQELVIEINHEKESD